MKEFEFTRYVVPLRDRMFRYAQSLLLCADEAEDVTHDLLERLWTERGRLDGCRDIASFVMAAVRNRCYDCLRLRRADGRRNNAVAGWAERATTGDAEGWEARDLVRRAMAELPGQLRHRTAHQVTRFPPFGIPRRRTLRPSCHSIVAAPVRPPQAQAIVTTVAHGCHHEGSDVTATVEPPPLRPQPLQQVVRHVLGLVGAKQQALCITEHTVAERHNVTGEFEFLHCICKTKQPGKTQHRIGKYRNFFLNRSLSDPMPELL